MLWVTGSLETTLKERHSLGSSALPEEAASFMCAVCAAACSKPVSLTWHNILVGTIALLELWQSLFMCASGHPFCHLSTALNDSKCIF